MEYIVESEASRKTKDRSGITLRDVAALLLSNWIWTVLSILVCLAIARAYIATLTPLYSHQTVMLIKEESKSRSRNDVMGEMLIQGGLSGSSTVENEIFLIRTNQLMRSVVERLGLDVS